MCEDKKERRRRKHLEPPLQKQYVFLFPSPSMDVIAFLYAFPRPAVIRKRGSVHR